MIKNSLIFFALLMISTCAFSQRVTNMVYVGDKGITKNLHEAHSIVVVKQLLDKKFQRLDYNKQGPLRKLRTYRDTALSILEGPYMEYYPSGVLKLFGKYQNNLMSDIWYSYDESGKTILMEQYINGSITTTIDPSVFSNCLPDIEGFEQYAEFISKKGNGWKNYITNSLEGSKAAEKSLNGGSVIVGFTIDTTGQTTDIFIKKSVEYVLDEEGLSVIRKSPKWKPAIRKGKKVRSLIYQPLTFIVF